MRWRCSGAAMGIGMAVVLLGAWPSAVRAQGPRPEPGGKRQRDAVHLVSSLRPNDPKLSETFDGAVTSLQEGHEVVILFDGKSVTWLRMHTSKGNATLLEEAPILGPERQALAERLGVPPSHAPGNYLEYVQHLARAGAQVFVNRNAVRLYGLAEREIHPIAKPLSAPQMAEILDKTDLCYTYGSR